MYDYYSMEGIPHLVWDGIVEQVGSGADDADGANFQAIINERLADESPLSVTVKSFRLYGGDPYLNIEVEVFEELDSIDDTYLRIGICENGVSWSGEYYTNILRDMPTDIPLTVQYVGEVQEVTVPLTIAPFWDPSELYAYGFVQRDSDKYIYNAGSTFVTPHALSLESDGAQATIIDGTHTFGTTEITNIGSAFVHTVDITMDLSELPAGWDAYFTLNGVDQTFATVTLGQGQTIDVDVTIIPGEQGYYGNALLNLHSQGGEMPDVDIPYTGIRADADVLIVGSDINAAYAEEYFGPAIATTGRSYAVWDRSYSDIDAATMENFETVIWTSGDIGPGLYEVDRNAIETYLESGGNMLISGQRLAQQTAEIGASSWLVNVLRAFYQSTAQGGPLVAGVDGDEVSDGFSLDLEGGDGAGNYDTPSVVAAFGGSETIFNYTGTGSSAGLKADYNGYKHILLGFGFESINSAADREALLASCLLWLMGAPSPVPEGLPQVASLNQNLPNPFNPQTTITFDLPSQMAVSMHVYDMSGRLVDVLLSDEVRQQGRNEVIWSGRDASGRSLPSGTYFYRLDAGEFGDTKRMTLLK